MPYDFPASPTEGQTYSPAGGPDYVWHTASGAWDIKTSGSNSAFVAKTGDIMSGQLGLPTGPAASNAVRKDYVDAADAAKVSKTGDAMSGNLNINVASPQLLLSKTASGQGAFLGGYTGTSTRWVIQLGNSTAESGGNAGSDFEIDRYNDSAGWLGSPLLINRASGAVTIAQALSVGGALSSGPMNANGNRIYCGFLYSTGNVQAAASLMWGPNGDYIYADTNATLMLVNGAACYWSYTKSNGYWQWVVNNAITIQLQYPAGFLVNGAAYKPGGGVWSDSSDARIKNVQGDYAVGLDAVAQLRPVTFTYKGNDTTESPDHIPSADGTKSKDALAVPYPNSPHRQVAESSKTFHGLIAQEVEAIFPEMVTVRNGYIDGEQVNDIRDLDTTPLIFALINAIKELKARVETLEGA
jgi:hypothetical protein